MVCQIKESLSLTHRNGKNKDPSEANTEKNKDLLRHFDAPEFRLVPFEQSAAMVSRAATNYLSRSVYRTLLVREIVKMSDADKTDTLFSPESIWQLKVYNLRNLDEPF